MTSRRGSTLIDLLISMAILTLLFGAIFLTYYSILGGSANVEERTEASSVVNRQIEILRNLAYDQVGTVGGIPAGIIPQTQAIPFGLHSYNLRTTVRNVDDPFDGTLGGTPNDTAPADYKLVEFEITCSNCQNFRPFSMVSTVAPKNLESAGSTGSLFVNVFDAAGLPVPGATVRIINASTSPSIDLTDITNVSGILQLIGVPSSTQRYQVLVSKSGYSSEQTYPLGGASNPNPVKPNATVAAQTVTNVSFAIDKLSTLNVLTSDEFCTALPSVPISITGSKLIGTPSVLKYPATSSVTDASGLKTFSNMEWDTYALSASKTGYDLMGTSALVPFLLTPSTTLDMRFIFTPADASALLITARDIATGQGISGATATISRPGFTETSTAGRAQFAATDWTSANYTAKSTGLDASVAGSISLLANASGTYPLTEQWLESKTVDFGGSATTLHEWQWEGITPGGAGADSVKFQLAANNDNATWDYTGPDGTSATFYMADSTNVPASLDGKRYLRYKAYLSTANDNVTPRLDSVSLRFSGMCVPPYQMLFQGLGSQTFDIEVSAAGYATATSSVTISTSSTQVVIDMNQI
jgi:hypothetical protein